MTDHADAYFLDAVQARAHTSSKWRSHPQDVLPMDVAEMDCRLAPAVRVALHRAVDGSDTGYAAPTADLAASFARFADRRWGWSVDPDRTSLVTDVSVAMVETLRVVTRPGDRIAYSPPVYPPFPQWIAEVGCLPVTAPLRRLEDHSLRLDLDAVEAAFRAGVRAYLLCNPHNPVGTVHGADELTALAALAERYGVVVVSDEIHAPLTHPGRRFTPYLTVSDGARGHGVALVSPSKGWNLAGLKAAMVVTDDAAGTRVGRVHQELPAELRWRTGHLGVLAGVAAYDHGEPWLDGLVDMLETNARSLEMLLAEHLPEARYAVPDAGYLAWLDLRGLGWGDDPAATALHRHGLALAPGPDFGPGGEGHARLNFGCHPSTLVEGMQRLSVQRMSGHRGARTPATPPT